MIEDVRSHRTVKEFNRYWDSVIADGAVYVAWGGGTGRVQGKPYDLGVGVKVGRGRTSEHFGGWLYYAAQGYVNGYPTSAILYFLLTRCMGAWVWHRTYWREPDVTGQKAAGHPCSPNCHRQACERACPDRSPHEGHGSCPGVSWSGLPREHEREISGD